MSELKLETGRTAVLAMDFQQGIVSGNNMAGERGVIDKACSVLDAARKSGITVIHVVLQFRDGYPEISPKNRMFSGIRGMERFLAGSEETGIVEAVSPKSGDVVVRRPRVNAFYGSDLQTILASSELDTLVLMGVATNWVVEATARYAADADYRVIVLEDCCAGLSVEAHDFSIDNILGRIGEISTSEDFLKSLE